ncbi:tyrosine/phenylalanine carboxypeptidase domain-containing protein [Pendulispora albinea]|uniref:Flavohemoglobin expression-modulating QEGLA motif protein n=1 Tax=Pendulispora albinea TaxID=2741071 RepID=A0ABZ2M506_9BACT
MSVEKAKQMLATVAAVLGARKSTNLLEDIAWNRKVEAEFFEGGGARIPEVSYAVDREALDRHNDELSRAEASLEGDGPIAVWLRAVVRSVIDKNRLLLAAGTMEFGKISREIYGGARSTFFGLPVRNIDLAEHLLERLRIHGWDEAEERNETPMDAQTFADDLTRRIEKRRPPIKCEVILDEHCTAKAIAGMTKVRVRPGATFFKWEAEGLYCHEVETHAFTAHNGAIQEHAPFLRSGGPRTTPTQEGLAVFSELYNRTLATPRLERLALRVKLVEMAEDGATFLDLYRLLVERGSSPRDAFLDAARVCRGGVATGGSPFTKDACYLAGLLHVHAFLAAFVRGGFRDETELLFCGRIALEDVSALASLRSMGLLSRPVHRPRWLARWSTLLPYFAFNSFMDGIELASVEARYRELIERAERAAPKP